MTRLIDISPPIDAELAVFPGDTAVSREILLDMRRGDALTLSTLRATVHLGAHIDAPSHYGRDAATIEATDLARCLGPCRVLRPDAAPGARLRPEDLGGPIDEERILLATGTHPDPRTWRGDFAALAPETVDHLADRGVRLLGIDTPSVDLADDADLIAHHRFLARDVTILEGLVLTDVAPGRYELIALPLRLVGFDASPVRAVLRELG